MEYRCILNFTSKGGKRYNFGDIIIKSEYDTIDFHEKSYFMEWSKNEDYKPDEGHYVAPISFPSFSDCAPTVDNSYTEPDTPDTDFGGGDTGGGGAQDNY